MLRGLRLSGMREMRSESLNERMEHLKKLLNGDDSKYRYDYFAHSREYLNMVMNYGSIVGTEDRETEMPHCYIDHFKTYAGEGKRELAS